MANKKRRKAGEGSVYQRKSDGRWVAQIVAPNGRPVYRYRGSEEEAEAALAQLRVELELGSDYTRTNETLGQHMRYYLDNVRRVEVEPSTWKREDAVYRTHIEPHLGDVPLSRITPRMLQELVTRMDRAGYASRTVRYPIEVLKRGLDLAVVYGKLQSNPATVVSLPQLRYRDMRPFDDRELREFLEAASDQFYAAYTLAALTGLRWGEVFGLSWEYVDLRNRELRVVQQLSNGQLKRTLKTNNARRTVILPGDVVDVLGWHRERFGTGRNGLVFVTGNDTPYQHGNVHRNFQITVRRAGLSPMRSFHDLRHTAITNMIRAGIDLKTITQMAGHGDVNFMLKTYGHVLDSMREVARERLDRFYETVLKLSADR